MNAMETRYFKAQAFFTRRMADAIIAARVNPRHEAQMVARLFNISAKRRSASAYQDVAQHLVSSYAPEVAYAIAIEINDQFEKRVGYPPIGQIVVALEVMGGERAARVITCSLQNFPKVETARLAFKIFKYNAMRSLLRENLAAEDPDLAYYICGDPSAWPHSGGQATQIPTSQIREASGHQQLSDGIERMPRRLTAAELRADRLYVHLQVISNLAIPFFPILGFVLKGVTGSAVGLVVGWCIRAWMRHSMGLRGTNAHDGFFIRMRERANGSHRGLLEILIEHICRRPFARAQCVAITKALDETQHRLIYAVSDEDRQALIQELDSQVKKISYSEEP
jgi:hypothetical protein